MAIIQADAAHPQIAQYNGVLVTRLRSVTQADGEAFDLARAKTVCKLPDGTTEVIVWNTELQPSAGEV